MSTDWVAWHDPYTDPGSALSRRLRAVQGHIESWLDESAPRLVQVLSICAGDGRDLLGVLSTRPDAPRVTATLVELVPELADRARSGAAAAGLTGIDVRCADAGTTESYAGCPPADLVLLCGVLGNISDEDVERVIASVSGFCAPGARVIWTRSRRSPDLTPSIRSWFRDSGCAEVAFDAPDEVLTSVGVHQLVRAPEPAARHTRLFTFVR